MRPDVRRRLSSTLRPALATILLRDVNAASSRSVRSISRNPVSDQSFQPCGIDVTALFLEPVCLCLDDLIE
jgi:hypothetical protein